MNKFFYLIAFVLSITSCSRTSMENDIKERKLTSREGELNLNDELRRVFLLGNSNDSYLNVVVIGNEGEVLTNWSNYTFNSQPVQALYSDPGTNDPPPTDCCEIGSMIELIQVCPEIILFGVTERGLDWDDNMYQVINIDTDKLVNGIYIDIANKEFRSYQEVWHDAFCSEPIRHGNAFFYASGELSCGQYKITYKKGFYLDGDPQFVMCDQHIDLISYLP